MIGPNISIKAEYICTYIHLLNNRNCAVRMYRVSKIKNVKYASFTKGGPGEYSLQNQETPLIKNIQFVTNFDETLPKCSPHGSIILTKFH